MRSVIIFNAFHNIYLRLKLISGLVLFHLILLALTSCASKKIDAPELRFPSPPNEARFIFERTLRTSTDVSGLGFMDKVRISLTGSSHVVDGLVKPFGVAVHQGRVYVTDTVARSVKVFDLAKLKYFELGTKGQGTLVKPLGIDVSSKGEVFVSDNTARRVVVFDRDGNYLRAIGGQDTLRRPSGLSVSPDGTLVYVVETGGVETQEHHLLIFDAQNGELLRKVGKRGKQNGEFNLPLQAATAPDGTVYVVDSGNFRVQAFTPSGNFKFSFGSIGRRSGQFSRPKGISTDPQGNIYVVDTAFGNFQIFSPDKQLLLFIGGRGQSGGPAEYMLPSGIDVDENGRVYVVDQFFRKVDIYRPAHLKPTDGFAAYTKK